MSVVKRWRWPWGWPTKQVLRFTDHFTINTTPILYNCCFSSILGEPDFNPKYHNIYKSDTLFHTSHSYPMKRSHISLLNLVVVKLSFLMYNISEFGNSTKSDGAGEFCHFHTGKPTLHELHILWGASIIKHLHIPHRVSTHQSTPASWLPGLPRVVIHTVVQLCLRWPLTNHETTTQAQRK